MGDICINHPRIVAFYDTHKHLNIEHVNLALIDLYETFLVNQEDIPKNAAKDIFTHLHELKRGIDAQAHQITHKFHEMKDSCVDNIKTIVDHHTQEHKLFLLDKLAQEQRTILEQTTRMVQEDHERLVQTIQERMTQYLDGSKSDVSMDKIHLILSQEYNTLLGQVQQNVMKNITASEERIRHSLQNVQEVSAIHQNHQEKLNEDLVTFLRQYKVSQKKGEFGENMLNHVLCALFPSSEIINTTGQTSAGDFMVKREGKPTILFENKNYDSVNVPKKEVDKFLVDVEQQNCSGILMSQRSGIALKRNFEIDINHGNVLVYIHNMNYDPEKITVACDIIDHLTDKLKHHTDKCTTVPEDILSSINQQYQSFLEKREKIILNLNEHHKRMVADMKELTLSTLNDLLSSTFATTKLNTLICDICKSFTAMNPKALSAHRAICKKKTSSVRGNKRIEDVIPPS